MRVPSLLPAFSLDGTNARRSGSGGCAYHWGPWLWLSVWMCYVIALAVSGPIMLELFFRFARWLDSQQEGTQQLVVLLLGTGFALLGGVSVGAWKGGAWIIRRVRQVRAGADKLPLTVIVHTAACDSNLATLFLQVVNRSSQDAASLTFSLVVPGAPGRWAPDSPVRGIPGPAPYRFGLSRPPLDPGMDSELPHHPFLKPLSKVEGWITFEPCAYYGVTSFLLSDENAELLVLEVLDDVSGRTLAVPIRKATEWSTTALTRKNDEA